MDENDENDEIAIAMLQIDFIKNRSLLYEEEVTDETFFRKEEELRKKRRESQRLTGNHVTFGGGWHPPIRHWDGGMH